LYSIQHQQNFAELKKKILFGGKKTTFEQVFNAIVGPKNLKQTERSVFKYNVNMKTSFIASLET